MSKLSKAEATSRELYRLVASGQIKALTQGEKDVLLPQHLAALAGSGQMALTQRDKNRLTPAQLAALLEGLDWRRVQRTHRTRSRRHS